MTMQARTRLIEGDFVLLRTENVGLLLPRAEVGDASFVEPNLVAMDETSGLLMNPDADDGRFYVALSGKLRPLGALPPQRYLSTALGEDMAELQWCWDEVRMLNGFRATAHALAACLVAPHTPVREYVDLDGEVVFVCDAQALTQYALAEQR